MQGPQKQRKRRRLPGSNSNGCVRHRALYRNHVSSCYSRHEILDLRALARYGRCMAHKDARSLPPEAQEDLRRRVIDAVLTQGMKKAHAARTFGV